MSSLELRGWSCNDCWLRVPTSPSIVLFGYADSSIEIPFVLRFFLKSCAESLLLCAASSKEYYFRGNPTMVATETTTEVSESEPSIKDVESIERRELEFHIMMDYTPSANCKKNCIP